MILLLKHDATEASIRELKDAVVALGLSTTPLDDGRGKALEVVGADPSQVLGLREHAAVAEILTRRTPLVGGEPVWPHFTLRLLIVALVLLSVLALLTGFVPRGLGDRASGTTTGPLLVEWYLRPLLGFKSLLGPLARVGTGLFWVLFFAWPFLDRANTARGRLLLKVMGGALLLLVVVLGFVA
jgi:quinol-cytochrome oxidoreductase complex cytochrome b subunit